MAGMAMTRKRWLLLLAALVLIGPLMLAVAWYLIVIFPMRNGI
jgi:hypothetical protein